jgi:hypothetical protein
MLLPHALRAVAKTTSDPNFKQTTLLLHGDGTNGAQNNTFLDGSTNNYSITRTGTPTQGTLTPFSVPAGYWSNYFDGTGDYLNIADNAALNLSGDFTIDLFVYWQRRPGASFPRILAKGDYQTAAGSWIISITESTGVAGWGYGNPFVNFNFGTLSPNTWAHLAVVRSGSTVTLYFNGVQASTGTVTQDLTTTSIVRVGGGTLGSPSEAWAGYISNVRIVKGTAVYTGNFTPPTAPLTAITNTSLLTCQNYRFVDNSSNNFTVTKVGDTRITPFSPFAPTAEYSTGVNGGSLFMPGSGNALTTSGTNLDFISSSSFTIEIFAYPTATAPTSFAHLISQDDGISTNQVYQLAISTSSTVRFLWFTGSARANNASITSTATIPLFAWAHIAVSWDGTTLRLFVNGVLSASTTSFSPFNSGVTNTGIGNFSANPTISGFFTGYLSNPRVVKGTAVYTSNFTPPTAPLTAITNTVLLLNGTNAGIFDNTAKNVLETVGNAQISTSVKKYGTGSMFFDGTGDWLLVQHTPDQILGNANFTIEAWVYLNATGTARGIVGKGTSTTGWLLSTNTSNQVVFTHGTSTITSTGTLAGSTWYHIAVVRSGIGTNETKIYVAGTNDGTGTVSTDFNQANAMYIGADRTATSPMNGYIDDLRITKGVARYTANFTPPSGPFPNQ